MKKIIVHSKNLNNSLVFYRALFDRMPIDLGLSSIQFETDQLTLNIHESRDLQINGPHLLEVRDPTELQKINLRMRKFKSIERLREDCDEVGLAIGLTDPDGNKWVIGDLEEEVSFEKCYINSETF